MRISTKLLGLFPALLIAVSCTLGDEDHHKSCIDSCHQGCDPDPDCEKRCNGYGYGYGSYPPSGSSTGSSPSYDAGHTRSDASVADASTDEDGSTSGDAVAPDDAGGGDDCDASH